MKALEMISVRALRTPWLLLKGIHYNRTVRLRMVMTMMFMLADSTFGLDIEWNSTNSGNWNVAANWSPAQVPSTNDTVIITNAGTYTVALNINAAVSGLVLGGSSGTQTITTAERTLTMNGSATVGTNGVLHLSGGWLAGSGPYEIAGKLDWTYGGVASNAFIEIQEDGRCDIASVSKFTKTLSGHLSNAGALTWQQLGNLIIDGTLYNAQSGTMGISADNSSLLNYSGTGTILNDGVIHKTGGSGNINMYAFLINNGTVDVQVGTFTLLSGSVWNQDCSFTGSGKIRLTGGSHTVDGAVYSENLNLEYNATLEGTGTVSGTIFWGGGIIGSNAVITIATNGYMQIASDFQHAKVLQGDLVNAGTVVFRSLGNVNIGGSLHNLPGGELIIATDNVSFDDIDGAGTLLNEGSLIKSGGTIGNIFYLPVVNSGTMNIQIGKFTFNEDFENPGGTISLQGGHVQSAQALNLEDGLLTGWGTVYASVTHGGIVRPSRTNGVMTISGDYIQQLAGTTVFELGGNTPGTNQSRLNVTGAAQLDGSIIVEWPGGYLPGPGTTFTVMAFASHTGMFDFENGFFLLGQDRRLESSYAPTSLTLTTVDAPDPDAATLGIAAEDGTLLIVWPLEFMGYDLYYKTNLYDPDWLPVSISTNRYFEYPPLLPHKFYRLF